MERLNLKLSGVMPTSKYCKGKQNNKIVPQSLNICKIVVLFGEIVGVQALYIYALPQEELIKYYKTLGFSRLDPEMEDFVHKHVKPRYDAGCYFMYQII